MTVVPTNVGSRKWWALAGLSLGVLAVGLDATVLSVALPTLAVSLHASATDLQWFVSAYTLALAAGAMVPLVLSVVAVMFTDEERPRAVGAWAAANFLALPIGPILGGWLLSNYWWGWVFLMNLPVVAIGLVAVTVLVPESRATSRPGLDPVGIVASSAGLAVLIYGFIAAGQYGWSSPTAIFAIVAGVAVLAAFVWWELRLTSRPGGQPLVDLSLFRSARFSWGTI